MWTVAATIPAGRPRLLWPTPSAGGSFSVTLSASDLAGNNRSSAPPARSRSTLGCDLARGRGADRVSRQLPARRRRLRTDSGIGYALLTSRLRRLPRLQRSHRRIARGRLPAGRVDGARLLPGDEARQAGARGGPGGVGKTELAKALASYLRRELVRLQCYEGLDEAKALYEWNYRKQLLRIQTERADTGWEEVQEDIFGEEFLLARPLMSAIASEEPVVLLIDEIDKTDRSSRRCCWRCSPTSRSRYPSSGA